MKLSDVLTKALVIIDVQKGMFAHGEPYDGERIVSNLANVLGRARDQRVPVFFVQHDGGEGSPLAQGSEGFAYHDTLAPLVGEDITVKRFCSSFQETDLFAKLSAAGADHIAVGGMQSEFCVDTAVRGAFERGLTVTLIADGHTTFDTPALAAKNIVAHHNHTLESGNFAKLVEARHVAFDVG